MLAHKPRGVKPLGDGFMTSGCLELGLEPLAARGIISLDMTHAHTHDHSHHAHGGHDPAPVDFGPAFLIGIGLNIGFVVLEAVFGWLSNSVALLADAGHNLSDVLGLVVAWVAMLLAALRPSARFTYGLRGSSILAALFNAVLLLVAVGGIGWEALMRFSRPEPAHGLTVILVAAAGILVNGITAWLFARGRHGDLNVRGAFLHMVADAAVSAGVVAAGILMLLTGWLWLDPLASLLICAVIVWGTWSLLRDSLAMSVDAVPAAIDPVAVRTYLCALPGVDSIHDLHIWAMSTTETALTAHLVMSGGHPGDVFLHGVAEELEHRFGIVHPTLQIETDRQGSCELAPDEVV
jgi:cobalt-zinc-cadmium efflux system protein